MMGTILYTRVLRSFNRTTLVAHVSSVSMARTTADRALFPSAPITTGVDTNASAASSTPATLHDSSSPTATQGTRRNERCFASPLFHSTPSHAAPCLTVTTSAY